MGIQRYPRPGQTIAPRLLCDVLRVPVDSSLIAGTKFRFLCDIDARVWEVVDASTCNAIADMVVQRAHEALSRTQWQHLLHTKLPELPHDLRLSDIDVSQRTYNCLVKEGFEQKLSKLSGLTIRDLLHIPAFGVRSLIDLLTAVEEYFHVQDNENSVTPTRRQAITSEDEQTSFAFYALQGMAHQLLKLPCPELLRTRDPRFGAQLATVDKHIKSLKIFAESILDRPIAPIGVHRISEKLSTLITTIESALTLTIDEEIDTVLRSLRHSDTTDRNVAIAIRYFGWASDQNETLQSIANDLGLTRERIRQICRSMELTISVRKPYMPVLHSALQAIKLVIPASIDNVEAVIEKYNQRKGIGILGIQSAAGIFLNDNAFSIEPIPNSSLSIFIPNSLEGLANSIVRIAKRTVSQWGVSTIVDISEQVGQKFDQQVKPDLVQQCLEVRNDFRWIDSEKHWFWLNSCLSDHNRLYNRLKKIISVANPVDVSDLRKGIQRHHTMEGFAPPQRVLLELCRQLPGLTVQGNKVFATTPLSAEEILDGTDQVLFRMFKDHGPLIDRDTLVRMSEEYGVKSSTLTVYLTYSPIIERYAYCVYGLRGAEITPGMAEALQPEHKQARLNRECGWSLENKVWLSFEISPAGIQNGAFYIPTGVREHLQGEFDLKAASGVQFGRLIVKGSSGWGLSPYYRRRGGDIDDRCTITFDIANQCATVEIGDSE